MSRRLLYGVGVNDADYHVMPRILGKRIVCPYYRTWSSMLERCYSSKFQVRHPTYSDCSVCDDWFVFSNFKKWMQEQNWQGMELDKDILIVGNRYYSPDNCVFVSPNINRFLTERASARGLYMLGVYWEHKCSKFRAQCNDGKGKRVFLGYFKDELSAHNAWKAYKHGLACRLADEQTDLRVAAALRQRYL